MSISDVIEVTSDLQVAGRDASFINSTDIDLARVVADPQVRQVAADLSRWVNNARAASGRTSMFDRGAYAPPDNPYDEMRAARHALKYDSVVSGVAEVTEGIAFVGLKWEGENADDADVFNQWSRDVNLDQVVRSMWREEFTVSQAVVAMVWGWSEFAVRGKTKKGNARKAKYRVWCPQTMRTLNPARVVPIDLGPLGGDRLAWASSVLEVGYYQDCYMGQKIDPLMLAFFKGRYTPPEDDVIIMSRWGVDVSNLLEIDSDWVFRHTATKSDYEPFPEPRLKSCFSLLDLKTQLMAADRAALIGNANYILHLKQGDKDLPARNEEMVALKERYNVFSKVPVIISDHRLEIVIIAPKTDFMLDGAKYEVLDNRILNRLLGTLTISGRGQRNETQVTISEIVARVMSNRRHMLKRSIEEHVAQAIVNHPKNKNTFEATPSLVFTPRNISLDANQAVIQALLALRSTRDVSRETTLETFGLDQATEAQRLENEEAFYDQIFKTLVLPGQTPPGAGQPGAQDGPNGTGEAPAVSGGRGGRPKGGGTTPANPVKRAKPRGAGGNPSTKAVEETE